MLDVERIRAAYEEVMLDLHRRAHRRELESPRKIEDAAVVVERGSPAAAIEARKFYDKACDNWGGAHVRCVRLGGVAVHAVIVQTDGDDGAVELYDEDGVCIAAARTYLEIVAWLPQSEVRALTAESKFPSALADRMAVAKAHRARWDGADDAKK